MPQIKVEVDPYGQIKMEGVGFKDGACKTAIKPFENAFKGADVHMTEKPEARIPVQGTSQVQAGQQ